MRALEIESWIWFAVVTLIVLARLTSRTLFLGHIKRLQIDDYLMVLAWCTYLALIKFINISADSISNLVDASAIPGMSKQEKDARIYGSKIGLVSEQLQCGTLWIVKACLLIMYGRLTMSLQQHVLVKIVACYTAFGFILMEILYWGVWCRPVTGYWAVPAPNKQCSTVINHLITQAVLNISSDLLMISIPFPILIKAQLPLKRKVLLFAIFSLGFFEILCAILTKVYSFSEPFGTNWVFWYIRESSTAMVVSNIPFTWKLLQRMIPSLRSFGDHSNRQGYNATMSRKTKSTYIQQQKGADGTKSNSVSSRLERDLERSESTERIHEQGKDALPLEIWQETEVIVTSAAPPSHLGAKGPVFDITETDRDDGSEKSSIEGDGHGVVTTCQRMGSPDDMRHAL